MFISDITRLGDKIDIQLVQQIEQQSRGELIGPIRTYKSSVFDYITDTEFEIAMPTENGRMVLFQVGLRCRMLFYTKKGLYTCDGIVQKRYKKDNFFVLAILVTSNLVKFQRREFFRIDCMIPMEYIPISQEVASLNATEHLFAEVQKPEYEGTKQESVILDISGGGIRFSTKDKLEDESYVLISMRLTNARVDQTFFIVTKIISSERSINARDRYINRGQFMFKDLKDREIIVRFVFDEERRIRQKEIR